MPRGFGLYVGLAAVLVAGLIGLLVFGPRWLATVPDEAQPVSTPAAEARKISARLFYVDEQGTGLQGVEQEVLFGPASPSRGCPTRPAPRTRRLDPAGAASPGWPAAAA